MDEVSVTRTAPPSTKEIVADEAFCRQVDPAEVLTAWARKRGGERGAVDPPRRTQDSDGAERLAVALARMWVEHPESLARAIQALEASRNGRS